jgi:hypothetical protein
MANPVMVNGINYSWGNITLVLFGVNVVGITKIAYSEKQEKKNNYGAGYQPIGRGYGNVEPSGSIEIYTEELKRIIAAAPNRSLLGIPAFDIQVVFGGNGVAADKDILRFCEFTEQGLTAAQNDTKLLVTLPLVIGSIER